MTPIALQSNFIEVAGTYVPLANHVKLLCINLDSHLNFDKHFFLFLISILLSYHIILHRFALILIRKLLRPLLVPDCWFQISSCQFDSFQHFFTQYPLSSARLKFLGTSRSLINNQHHISCQLTSFGNESILYWLLLSTVHSTTSALNTCHLYYIPMPHCVSFTLCPSICSPNLVSALLLHIMVSCMLALLLAPSSSEDTHSDKQQHD